MSNRQCFVIIPGQKRGGQYMPSLVIENEPGHRPMTGGSHKFAVPYKWGKTLAEAEAACADRNKRLGLTEEDVRKIIFSSMK